jgi:hypothetical protein
MVAPPNISNRDLMQRTGCVPLQSVSADSDHESSTLAMGQRAHYHALRLRLEDLAKQILMLQLRLPHLGGIDRLRCRAKIRKLEMRKLALRRRQHALQRANTGMWQDIKADLQAVGDELRPALDDFFERLDTKSQR